MAQANDYNDLVKQLRAVDVAGEFKTLSDEQLVTNLKAADPATYGSIVIPTKGATVPGRGAPVPTAPPPAPPPVTPSSEPGLFGQAVDVVRNIPAGLVRGAGQITREAENLVTGGLQRVAPSYVHEPWMSKDLMAAADWLGGSTPGTPLQSTGAKVGSFAGEVIPNILPAFAATRALRAVAPATTLTRAALTAGGGEGLAAMARRALQDSPPPGSPQPAQRSPGAEGAAQFGAGAASTLADLLPYKYRIPAEATIGAFAAERGDEAMGGATQAILTALTGRHARANEAAGGRVPPAGTPGAVAAALTPAGGPAPGHVGGAPAQPHAATLTDTVPKPVAFGMEGIKPNVPQDIIPGVGPRTTVADALTPTQVPPLGRPLGPPIPETTAPAPGIWPPPPDYGTGERPPVQQTPGAPPPSEQPWQQQAAGPTPGTTPAPLPADIIGGFETATPPPARQPDLMGGFYPGQGRPPVDQGGGPGTLGGDFYQPPPAPLPVPPIAIEDFYKAPPVPPRPLGRETGYVPPGVPPSTTPPAPLPPNLREAPPAPPVVTPPSPRPLPPSALPTPDSPFGQAVPPSGWPPLAPRTGTGVPMSLRPATPPDLPYGAASPLPRPTGVEPQPFGPQPAPRVTGRGAMEPPPPLAPVDATLSPTQQQEMRDLMGGREAAPGVGETPVDPRDIGLVTNRPAPTTPEGMIIEDIDRPPDTETTNAPVGGAERRRRLLAERTKAKFANPDFVPPGKTPSMLVGRGGQVKKKVDASDAIQFDHGIYNDADGNPIIDLGDDLNDPKTKELMDELNALLHENAILVERGKKIHQLIGYDPDDPLGINSGKLGQMLDPKETLEFTNDTLKDVWTQFQKRPGHTKTLYVNQDAMHIISSIFGGDIINNTTHGANIKPVGRELIQDRLRDRFYDMHGLSPEARDGVVKLSDAIEQAWDAIGKDESLKLAVAKPGKVFKGLRDTVYEEWAHGGQNKVTIDPGDVKAITSSPEYKAARQNLNVAYSEGDAFDEITAKAMANRDLKLSVRQNLTLVEMYRDAVERAGGVDEFTLLKPTTREVFKRGKPAAEVATAAEARESAALAAREAGPTAELTAARGTGQPPPAPGEGGTGRVGPGGDQQLQPGATGGREGAPPGGRSKRGVPAEPAGVVGDGGPGPGRAADAGRGGAAVESPVRYSKESDLEAYERGKRESLDAYEKSKREATEAFERGRAARQATAREAQQRVQDAKPFTVERPGVSDQPAAPTMGKMKGKEPAQVQGFTWGRDADTDASPNSQGFMGSQYVSDQATKLWDAITIPRDPNTGQPLPRPNAQWSTDAEYNRVYDKAAAERARGEAGKPKPNWVRRTFNMNALDAFNSKYFSPVNVVKDIQDRISKTTKESPLPGDQVRVIFDNATSGNDAAAIRTRDAIRTFINKHLQGLGARDAQQKMRDVGIFAQAKQMRQVEMQQKGSDRWNEQVKLEKENAVKPVAGGQSFAKIDADADAGDVTAQMIRANYIMQEGITGYREALAKDENGTHYTGVKLSDVQKQIEQGSKYHQPMLDDMNAHFRSMLDESVADGRISAEFRDVLVRMYPEYFPVGRIMDSDVNPNTKFGSTRPLGNLSKQGTVRKLGGPSELPIEDPWQSFVESTYRNTKEATRNQVGRELDRVAREYKGWESHIRRVDPEEIKLKTFVPDATNSITFLENGKQVVLAVDPMIAAAARDLKPNQISLPFEIARQVARVLRGTATGAANPFFQLSNLAMDIGTNVINTGWKSTLKSPGATWDVVKDTVGKHSADLEYLRKHGGAQTATEQYRTDARPQVEWEVAKARKGAKQKALAIGKHIVQNPVADVGRGIRWLEDTGSKTEVMGRLRVFRHVRDQAVAKGMDVQQANLAGLDAARNQMANYRHQGSAMQDVNAITPYLNAGIRNIASGWEAARTNPEMFAFRLASYVVLPTLATTVYNLANPEREEAYLDSQDHDKDDNWLVVRPGVTDEDGRRKMAKWAIPGQYSHIVRLTRMFVEKMKRSDPAGFYKLAKDMGFSDSSAVPTTQVPATYDTQLMPESGWDVAAGLGNRVMPQVSKLTTDIVSGEHQFSGKPFVRKDLQALPKKYQIDKDTSRAVTALARAGGGSPAWLQGAITSAGGQAIPLGLNLADRAGQALGLLPPGKPGGIDLSTGFEQRFLAGRGGRIENMDREAMKAEQDATYEDLVGQLSGDQMELLKQNRVAVAPITPQAGDSPEVMGMRQAVKGRMMSVQLQAIIDHGEEFAALSVKERKEAIKAQIEEANHWLSTQTNAAGKLDPDEREDYWRGVMNEVEAAYGAGVAR